MTSQCSVYQMGRRQLPAADGLMSSSASGSCSAANSNGSLRLTPSGLRTPTSRETASQKTKSGSDGSGSLSPTTKKFSATTSVEMVANLLDTDQVAVGDSSTPSRPRIISMTSSSYVSCNQNSVSSPETVVPSTNNMATFMPSAASLPVSRPSLKSTQHQVISVGSSSAAAFAQVILRCTHQSVRWFIMGYI